MELLILPTWADLIGRLMLPILALFLLIAVVITRQRRLRFSAPIFAWSAPGPAVRFAAFGSVDST